MHCKQPLKSKHTCILFHVSQTDSWHKTYIASNKILSGQPVSLNPNHTHFLLVDDGIRGKYQGVASFRANLESQLASKSIVFCLLSSELFVERIIGLGSCISMQCQLSDLRVSVCVAVYWANFQCRQLFALIKHFSSQIDRLHVHGNSLH